LDGGTFDTSRPKVREVLSQLARSGFNYAYIRGDDTGGGTFTWENRHHRVLNRLLIVSLTDAEIVRGGLSVPGSRDDIVSTVEVIVRPTRVDSDATTVLYSLESATVLIQAGETNTSLFGPYRDPDSNDQIGGTAQIPPVAYTDFTMNSQADGQGSDLTGNFSVTASTTGLGVRFSINNHGGQPGYVTLLQLRGKGIYRFDAVVNVPVPGASYGTNVLTMEMPLQNSVNVAADIANYLAVIHSTPFAKVPAVRFLATRNDTLLEAAIIGEPGHRIGMVETVTGVSAEFAINSVRIEWFNDGRLYCTWGLELRSNELYWQLGIAGGSELGQTTYLGY
jgi:hypothetical protein